MVSRRSYSALSNLPQLPLFAALFSSVYRLAIHYLELTNPVSLGDVVRIAPNELSFGTVQAYYDIYGHATKTKKRFIKDAWYDHADYPGIVSVRDPAQHARQRKYLSHAFSAKSLRGQEPLIHNFVDMFIGQLRRLGSPNGSGINIEEALNWLTFDIIGDLTFGESFSAVAEGRTHFWVSLIIDATYFGMLSGLRRRLPIINLYLPFALPKNAGAMHRKHMALTREKMLKRLEMGTSDNREDFFSYLLRRGGNEVPEPELCQQSNTLIVAGSETTATCLTGIVFCLLSNQRCREKLSNEVRSRFQSDTEITGDATADLKYLSAVIEEGLRIFPPAPFGLPRISPGATIDGHYIPPGVVVSVDHWTTKHDERYWKDAHSFIPERWIGEGFGDVKEASQPFSLGPRACLGINLAYLEMRIILAKMVGMPCTFLTTRKPRGPPNRRVAEARAQSQNTCPSGSENEAAAEKPFSQSQTSSLVAPLTVEHLCSNEAFEALISDYLEHLYPLYPLVHRPRFRADFQNKRYLSDPSFYRLCISLSALTVCCLPQNLRNQGFDPEETVAGMVDKANRLVVLGKMSQNLAISVQPDMNDMLCSHILGLAFHCSGRTYYGWAHASEAVLCMRKLALFRRESHSDLDKIDSEICKRAFWMIFIVMAHDRLAYPVSHTGISYNPVYVDWDFLVLLDVDDPELDDTERSEKPTATPLISGIIAVIKLYLCAIEIRPDKLPGNPRYGRFSPTLSFRPASFTPSSCLADTSRSPGAHGLTLEQGLNVVQALRNVICQLPDELKLFNEDGCPITGLLPFAIARANVYMTSLFIQSIILATLSANNQSFQQPNASHSRMEPQDAIQSQEGKHVNRRLLDLRKDIAQESYHIVVATPISALKANGIAVVSKLREITSALLSCGVDSSYPADEEDQVQSYIKHLIATLVNLDYVKELHEE
ncbi:hypothetical protein FDECE_4109 [Fusarium decemcellulare]|nr:hypothetical protein FDECE_4109 [Fusarium decemcellulare]